MTQRLQKSGQRLESRKEKASLNLIVNNALKLLDSIFSKRRLKVSRHLDEGLEIEGGTPVYVDKEQIEQVIVNLILNAIDASHDRSKLLIETQLINKNAEFKIVDYGSGIRKENFRHLFKPFFTTKKSGTGLGLYMSKIIVEDNHRGSLEFRSKLGKGTTFSILLPTNPPA